MINFISSFVTLWHGVNDAFQGRNDADEVASASERQPERTQMKRRQIMKYAGVGGVSSVLPTRIARAQDGDRGHGNDPDHDDEDNPGKGEGRHGRCRQAHCLHPFLGWTDLPNENRRPPETADHEVELHIRFPPAERCGPFHFDPVGLHVQPGDVVHFAPTFHTDGTTAIGGDHTVTSYHPSLQRQRRIPEDASPFSSPIVGPDVSWYYRFDEEGIYDIYCGPHESLGMVMRVVVGEAGFSPVYRVNAAGSAGGAIDGWEPPDSTGGVSVGGSPSEFDTSDTVSPDYTVPPGVPSDLFRTVLYGDQTWEFDVTPGQDYELRLYFSEIYWSGSGKREFDVSIDYGSPTGPLQALDDYDIYADVGADVGTVKGYAAITPTDGTITIEFTSVTDNAAVSAIELVETNFGPAVEAPSPDATVGPLGAAQSVLGTVTPETILALDEVEWDRGGGFPFC